MANAEFKNEEQLEEAKKKTKGVLDYRRFKDGRVVVSKKKIQRKKKK